MTKPFKHEPMTTADIKYLEKHHKNKPNPYMLHDGKPVPLDHPDIPTDERLKALLFKQAEQKARKKKKPVSLKDRIPFGKAANKREQDEKLRKKGLVQYGNKAHGGYVKKYAKGGGVRKVKT